MFADWADFWRRIANMNVATVAALPNRYAITLEYDALFDVFEDFLVAFFVFGFNLANFFEELGDFFKTFFAGFFGEFDIHFGLFVVFALDGVF